MLKFNIFFGWFFPFFLFSVFSSLQAESLPKNLKWETNNSEPIFENYSPKKGGELRTYIQSYPQTFRLYGLNSNSGEFVSFNRMWAFWSLVGRHSTTGKIIPLLATHWAVLPDQKTVYYKLDPDAKWSDGKKITAEDYLFAYQFLQSKDIQDPFYNQYIRDHYTSLTKIDEYTLKFVAKKPSWRILDEVDIVPLPKHATTLNKDWNKTAQWLPNVVPGPYVLDSFKKGQYVIFSRIKNWWGGKKRYFKELYHFDRIRLDVIQSPDTAYDLFLKGQLDIFSPSEIVWAKKTSLPNIEKGYIWKERIRSQTFSGASGFFFNHQDPIWNNPNLRKAFAHSINFEGLNTNIFYNLYQRKNVFFDSAPPYRSETIKAEAFDLNLANSYLEKEGWKRTESSAGYRQKNGQTLILKITTGSENALRYLPNIKETAKKAGMEVSIEKLDGPTFFDAVNQRKFQAVLLGFGGGRFPEPRQFLHTETLKPATNNIFMFGSPEMDALIETYQFDLSEPKRVSAILEIEKKIRESAIYIPSWKEDSDRLLRWRYIQGPPGLTYKTGVDLNLLYFDAEEKKHMEEAKKNGASMDKPAENSNPYDLK